MSKHLEHAEYSLKRTHNKEPLAEILFQLIQHIKQQDKRIAALEKLVRPEIKKEQESGITGGGEG